MHIRTWGAAPFPNLLLTPLYTLCLLRELLRRKITGFFSNFPPDRPEDSDCRYTLSARLEIPITGLVAERRRLPPPVTGGERLGELHTSARPS
jgi:hypothetical protein